ncbi:MAG: N-acetyltransferase [Rickettsiales bacterium]|nr:N-acetyltransferase [Rickettsiales bacterium]
MIRKTEQGDISSLETLYQEAFPEEDLWMLVTELLKDEQHTLTLSALQEDVLVGHIMFTRCHAQPEHIPLVLLGPMAVLPTFQRQGIGGRLIEEGLTRLRQEYIAKIFVLGDPNYYSRSGFTEESSVLPAYSIPEEWKPAWQSIELTDCSTPLAGKLNVTKPWQRKELWSE